MSTTALTTDGRFPVRRKRPNRPSVDNAFPSSWCPHYGVRFKLLEIARSFFDSLSKVRGAHPSAVRMISRNAKCIKHLFSNA